MSGTIFGPKGRLCIYLPTIALVALITFPAYADPTVKTTSGGTINVSFSTDPASPNPGDQTQLKISFINKQSGAIQPHIDYKVSVMEGNNQIAGIPVTHTAEGSVSIPVQFQDAATYQVIVEVDGILFQPIPPETATFTVNVGSGTSSNATLPGNTTGVSNMSSNGTNSAATPEFGPVVVSLVLVFSIVGVIILSARTRVFLKF
jgi:hypothetical protein